MATSRRPVHRPQLSRFPGVCIASVRGRLLGLRALRPAGAVPAGPGLSRCRCVSDGRGTVTGPGRAGCSRPIPVAPASGPASARPATGLDRRRADCIFTGRCVGAPRPRSRRRTTVQTWPPARSGTGCSPLGLAPSSRVTAGLPRLTGFAVLTPLCPGSRRSSGMAALPAGRPLELSRDGGGCRGRAVRGRRAARGVAVASPTDGTGSRGSGPARVRRGRPLCVPRCGRMRGRSPPYTPRPCRLDAAAASVASRDGRMSSRRRPAVTGWVYGGDRALTANFSPSLVWQGRRRCRAAPDKSGVKARRGHLGDGVNQSVVRRRRGWSVQCCRKSAM